MQNPLAFRSEILLYDRMSIRVRERRWKFRLYLASWHFHMRGMYFKGGSNPPGNSILSVIKSGRFLGVRKILT